MRAIHPLNGLSIMLLTMQVCGQTAPPVAEDGAASSSLMVTIPVPPPPPDKRETPSALRDVSLFALPPIEPRKFQPHDLVQIIVRETSKATSSHELETKKEFDLSGQVSNWNDMLALLTFGVHPSNADTPVEVDFAVDKEFKGEGDYERKDDLTARLTAEVIDVLPNGSLVPEAQTQITNDQEQTVMKVTGICRGADVTAANTVMSNQIHDLKVERMNSGELKKAGEKGIIAKVLEMIFAF